MYQYVTSYFLFVLQQSISIAGVSHSEIMGARSTMRTRRVGLAINDLIIQYMRSDSQLNENQYQKCLFRKRVSPVVWHY